MKLKVPNYGELVKFKECPDCHFLICKCPKPAKLEKEIYRIEIEEKPKRKDK